MPRTIPLAALMVLLLAASGCFSPSTPGGTSGTGTGTGGPGSGANATVEFSCTAQPGGVVGGVGGEDGATVSGCTLTKTTQRAEYVSEELPSGCSVSVFLDDGDNLSDGVPSARSTYEPGTTFSMGCGPSNPTGKGTIHLRWV